MSINILFDLIMTLLSYIASFSTFLILIFVVYASTLVSTPAGGRTVPNDTHPAPAASSQPPATESAPRRPSSTPPRPANSREDEDTTARDDDQSATSARRRSKYSRTSRYSSGRRSDKSMSTPEPAPEPVTKPVDKVPKASFKHLDNPFNRYPPGYVPQAEWLQRTTGVDHKQYSNKQWYKPMIDPIRGQEQLKASIEQPERALDRQTPTAVQDAAAIDDRSVTVLEASQESIHPVIVDSSCHRERSASVASTVSTPTIDSDALECSSGLSSTTTADHNAPLVIPQYLPRPKLETLAPLDRSYKPSQKILLAKSIHQPPRITSGMKHLFLDDVESLNHKFAKMSTVDKIPRSPRTNQPSMESIRDINTMDFEWESTSTSVPARAESSEPRTQTDWEMAEVKSVTHISDLAILAETIPEVYVEMAPPSPVILPMDVERIPKMSSVFPAPVTVQPVQMPPLAPLLPSVGAQLLGQYVCGDATVTAAPTALDSLSPFKLPPFSLPPSTFRSAPSLFANGNPQPSQALKKSPELAKASKIPPILRRPKISPLLKPTTHLLPARKSSSPYVLLEPKFERPFSQSPPNNAQIPCINVRSYRYRPEPTTPTPKGRHRSDKTLMDIYRRQPKPISV